MARDLLFVLFPVGMPLQVRRVCWETVSMMLGFVVIKSGVKPFPFLIKRNDIVIEVASVVESLVTHVRGVSTLALEVRVVKVLRMNMVVHVLLQEGCSVVKIVAVLGAVGEGRLLELRKS